MKKRVYRFLAIANLVVMAGAFIGFIQSYTISNIYGFLMGLDFFIEISFLEKIMLKIVK